jgi:hypothetical protein
MQIDDYIYYRSGDFVASGYILEFMKDETILIDTGSGGGRGLEYIKKEDIIIKTKEYTD